MQVTLGRTCRVMLARLIRKGLTYEELAPLFGCDKSKLIKFMSPKNVSGKGFTFGYLEHYAATLPGGAADVMQEMFSIAARLSVGHLSAEELEPLPERRGRKKKPRDLSADPPPVSPETIEAVIEAEHRLMEEEAEEHARKPKPVRKRRGQPPPVPSQPPTKR